MRTQIESLYVLKNYYLKNCLTKMHQLLQFLFNIFINDLNELFDKTFCQPAKIKNLTLNNLFYAGDLVLVSETSSGLQNGLDRLQEYCEKWRLTVNIKKNQNHWKRDNPQSTKPALLTKIMFSISVSPTLSWDNNIS